jgi:hypothetical protein
MTAASAELGDAASAGALAIRIFLCKPRRYGRSGGL